MKRPLFTAIATLGLCLTALITHAQGAEDYPKRPITLVVPFAAGGPTDVFARQLAHAMRDELNEVNIVVDNAGGAGGTIGAYRVARADPDGYTLLLTQNGMASAPALYRKLNYSPLDDFEFLGMVNDQPMVLIGNSSIPAETYPEFEKYIRDNAKDINMSHAGLGSSSHLCSMLWQAAIDLPEPMTTVPFRGVAPAIQSLIAQQVDIMCDQSANVTPHLGSGNIRAYAVTTAERVTEHAQLRAYPTLQEMGLNGFNLTIWHGLYAPRGTPPEIVQTLNQALRAVLKNPEFIEQQAKLAAYVVTDERLDPEGHKAFVAKEIERLGVVVEASGQFAD